MQIFKISSFLFPFVMRTCRLKAKGEVFIKLFNKNRYPRLLTCLYTHQTIFFCILEVFFIKNSSYINSMRGRCSCAWDEITRCNMRINTL